MFGNKGGCCRGRPSPARKHGYPFDDRRIGTRPLDPRKFPGIGAFLGKDCRGLIEARCDEHGWTIEELAIQPDHVHLFVRVWPMDSASDVLKAVKGVTSHELRKKYPQLCRLPSLWTRSFFASTAGNVSQETIRRYIDAQKGM